MATRQKFELSISERRLRKFSSEFREQKVREIERGVVSIAEICKEYEVSPTTVYRWIDKFGRMKKKATRVIVESESDTKKLLELKKKVAELERIIGQKQILLDFKDKMIDIAEEMYGVDIKKKLSEKPSGSSGTTENKPPSA